MKFIDALVFMFFLSLMVFIYGYSLKSVNRTEEAAFKAKQKFESMEFISESFRNTCNGTGFSSLKEWQKTCKAMWKLDYIGWSEAEDFMEVSKSEKGILMYGKWNGIYGSGEVFCRKRMF